MAQYSLHAYDADVNIGGFLGINNAFTELNGDLRYAAEVENMETPNGVLQPQAANIVMDGGSDFENIKIETLATFHRRWYKGSGSHDWLIACAGGKLYHRQKDSGIDWQEIPLPGGVDAFESSVWSWVTYEQSYTTLDDPPQSITVDVILMSNQKDGMIMVTPPDRPRTWGDLHDTSQTWDDISEYTWGNISSEVWQITPVTTGDYKFGVIERYAERIWGGNVADEPDLLVYSRPYKPTDWTAPGQDEQPEDGAGEVRQPTWDGDQFTGLKAFGDQLIAFKKHRVWRISGTNPGEYVFKEQYGDGAPYKNTIIRDVERIWLADEEGLNYYDGMSVNDYARQQMEKLWRRVNKDALDEMCAALFQRRYYLALPVDGSQVNNALVVFNQSDGTILFYKNIYIESLLALTDKMYATSSSLPGKVLEVQYNSWLCGQASGAATKWVTPWIDFGYKRIAKGGFDLYITPEVQDQAVTLKLSVQTEKKTKTKEHTVMPLTEAQRAARKEHRVKRLHFGGNGRKFRLIIETAAGNTAPWRLVGGVQLVVETDPD